MTSFATALAMMTTLGSPDPSAATSVATRAPALELTLAPAIGVTTRRLPTLAGELTRARVSPALALGGELRISRRAARRSICLYGQLEYLSSIATRTRETRTDGSTLTTTGRSQRVALTVGLLASRRVDARALAGLELGYALRPFMAEALLAAPAETLVHGPQLGVPVRARIDAARLELAVTPELALRLRQGGYPQDQVRAYGLGVGGAVSAFIRLHPWISLGLVYSESYALFEAVDPALVIDHERFLTARLRVGPPKQLSTP